MPVIVPHDPSGLVQPDSIAAPILKQSGLMVVRQLEMLSARFKSALLLKRRS